MKNFIVALVIAGTAVLPMNAYASCPDIHSGACCGTFWYEYDWTTSCAGTSGSVSSSTLSCYSTPAYAITGSSGTITYSYTIGGSDPIANTTHWSAGLFVDFDDPNNSQYNTLNVTVSVTHNGSTSSNTILSWNGQSGDISCGRYDYYFFTAVAGDTITVTISGTNFNTSNTTIKAAAPFLFNTY
jgi:hypothetical protein